MAGRRHAYSPPGSPFLRWLIDPHLDVSPKIATSLRDGLYASPWTLLVGVLNGLMVNAVALAVGGGSKFAWLIALDLSLVLLRMLVFKRLRRNAAVGDPTPTDLYLLVCIGWCAVQGAMGFFAMRTGIASLQVICAMTVAGLVGPICMRNFGTPRFAFALIGASLGPLVCGAVLSGNPWLLVLALQAPAFLFGAARMVGRLQALTVGNMQAEQVGLERARRDGLTGLLNRAGLTEAMGEIKASAADPVVCLYLDLDGFKAINDVHGHQAGDEVLKMVASRLSTVAGNGIVARLGGDEFVILAPALSPDDGHSLASKIVRAVGEAPYRVGEWEALRIGISVGFACAPDDALEHADLARKADAALYEAKSAGKNTQRRFDSGRYAAGRGHEWSLLNSRPPALRRA